MTGKRNLTRIVIIDEGVDLRIIKKEYPSFRGRISSVILKKNYNYTKDSYGLPINHGTLCTLLLIEALWQYGEGEQIEIVCVPITDKNGKKKVENLLEALEYCADTKFQIICMSLGVQELNTGRKLLNIISKMKDTIFLAAAANDYTIAYPAVFQKVIGVKRSNIIGDKIQIVKNPIDGIDLVIPYKETLLLQKLKCYFKLDYSNSNSILVPKVAAMILHKCRLNNITNFSKKNILNFLGKNSEYIIQKGENQIPAYQIKIDEDVPIILVEYLPWEYEMLKIKVGKLQKLFENKGYNCSVLCDKLKISNFKNAWYILPNKDSQKVFNYYRQILNNGLIILFLKDGSFLGEYADLKIFDKRNFAVAESVDETVAKIIEIFDGEVDHEKTKR